jgi:glutamyl-tRNA synthetase
MKKKIITRFAPSPTGVLHIGGARTALYNYLFSKNKKGKFILRIEDTDRERLVEGSENYITNSLKWLEMEFNENLKEKKTHLYRQFERKNLYKIYIKKLLDNNKAYYAFDTLEDLDKIRNNKANNSQSIKYDYTIRDNMKNSLVFNEKKVKDMLKNNVPYVIRLKVPYQKNIILYDLLRGSFVVNSSYLDDKILIKSNGIPTYHFANVIDDYFMHVSHVIRGEEWLSSLPVHILLYQYLGWGFNTPYFMHLPLLLNPNGKGKLSKRNKLKENIPIFPINCKNFIQELRNNNFKEKGYFSAALINFLIKLGWSSDDEEICTKNEFIKKFNIFKIGKSGIKFDIHKLNWFNQKYLQNKNNNSIFNFLTIKLRSNNINYNYNNILNICVLIKERSIFLNDFFKKGRFFFQSNFFLNNHDIEKKYNILKKIIIKFNFIKKFNYLAVKEEINNLIKKKNLKYKDIIPVVRFIITGNSIGPDLIKILELIKRKKIIFRIQKNLAFFFSKY